MKIIKIDQCVGCPSCEYDEDKWWCRELLRYVDAHSIPLDCPLEEATDEQG